MLRKIGIILILITWPLSLFFANTLPNFIHYIIPSILIFISFFLFIKKHKYFYLPLFLVPFTEPKLVLIPLLFLIITFSKKNIIPIIISLFILLIFLKPFFGQSIFTFDYEGNQKLQQDQKLYSSIFLARLFQNKLTIPLSKFEKNLFAITDPGNYFFGFAPRQITIDNQNLKKFPFLSIVMLLVGLYYISKNKNKSFLIPILIAIIINLSLLINFDRNDFVLWLPLAMIITEGLNILKTKFKYTNYYLLILIIFSLFEISRIILLK